MDTTKLWVIQLYCAHLVYFFTRLIFSGLYNIFCICYNLTNILRDTNAEGVSFTVK